MKTNRLWFCVLFGFIGAGLLVASCFMGVNTWHFVHAASHASGKVIRQDYGCTHVDVRFAAVTGETIDYGQNGDVCLHAGQAVNVLYEPSSPRQTATVDSTGALWGSTFWTGGMGIVFLLATLGVGLGSRFVYIKPGRY